MALSGFRSRFVMVNGVKTHYTEAGGDGPTIVAMHGGGAGSSGAAGLGALLQILSDEFRVIGLDSVGGFGETDPNAGDVSLGLQSRVDHLAAFVDAICLNRFTIMGNSQGAWCAAKYGIMRPDRVERMVLLGTGSISSAMGIKSPPSAGLKLLEGYDGTRAGMKALLEGLVFDKSKITDQLIDMRQSAAERPGAMAAFKRAWEANRKLSRDPLYKGIWDMSVSLPELTKRLPTIMIWGEDDIFAVPAVGRELEKLLPDVPFHWVAKAGHQVQTDQPEIVADIVRSFMHTAAREPVSD
jgi:pimeloyl-ACP methyl ester carboxylesterase